MGDLFHHHTANMEVHLFAFVAILSIGTAASDGGCDDRFPYRLDDMCYKYVNSNQTWSDAQNTCERLGAWLAEPTTQAQNDYFEKILFEHRGFTIWLGASDTDKEGEWLWDHSGERVQKGFTDWLPGEPNDTKDVEDCLEFQYDYGHWNDKYCDLQQHFVCQKPANGAVVG